MSNPSIVQSVSNDGSNGTQVNGITTTFASNVTAGNALLAFYTVSDYAGIHTDLVATDSRSNTYTLLDQQNTSRTGGAGTIASLLAVNTSAGANTVHTYLSTNGDVEDYQAACLVEIGNVVSSPLIGHSGNTQNALAPGTDNLVSGSITVGVDQLPCILVGIGFNTSNLGSHPAPTAGTGMTLLSSIWKFGTSLYSTGVAYQVITTAGTYQALFNQASSATEDCACVAVLLQGIMTLGLSGASSASATGSFVPGNGPGVVGQSILSAAGAMALGFGLSPAGQPITATAGLLPAATAYSVSGQSSTSATGTISAPPSADVTVTLNGQASLTNAGYLTGPGDVLVGLSGLASTSAVGSMAAQNLPTVIGQPVTANTGALTAAATIATTGQGATSAVGSLTFSIDSPMIGQVSAMTAAPLVPGLTVNTAGSVIASAPGGISLPGAGGGTTWDSGVITWDSSVQTWDGGTQAAIQASYGQIPPSGPGISPDYRRMFQPIPQATSAVPMVVTLGLTGQKILTAAGQLSAFVNSTLTLGLTGQGMTGTPGVVGYSSSLTVSLTGQAITSTIGTVIYAPTYPIDDKYEVNISPRDFLVTHDPNSGYSVSIAPRTFTVSGG